MVTALYILLASVPLFAQPDTSNLVWPLPPDQPRIKFLQSVTSIQQPESKKGFFAKVLGFLFGGEQQSGWFVQPVGIVVSGTGIIYVTDPGANGIHVLNLAKQEYDFLRDTKYGKLRSPVGCAIDADGNLYISDSERGDVIVLNKDLEAFIEVKSHLQRPTGIQVVGDSVYVADAGLHEIVAFDRKGNFKFEFGRHGSGAGEFNYPTHLIVRDSISVVDALNYRIQTFDRAGHFGSTYGDLGNVAGRFAAPKSIALDSDGNEYVTDALMDNIQIFNRAGALLLIVGKKGSNNGEFLSPSGIFIDSKDRIYVVDALNRRLQIFSYLK